MDKTIPRQIVKVTITLSDSRSLSGVMQIDLDTRLSDFMNDSEQFIVLQDNNNTKKIINKNHIIDIIILPD